METACTKIVGIGILRLATWIAWYDTAAAERYSYSYHSKYVHACTYVCTYAYQLARAIVM